MTKGAHDMKRRSTAGLVVVVLAFALALTGCAAKVRVETGERITCTYGHVVTDTVKAIEVPADKASQYRVVEKTVTCDLHKQLEASYAQAQADIEAGKLADAKAKLAEIVKADAAFRKAQAQLDALLAGKTPPVDTGGPTSTPSTSTADPGDGKVPVGPVPNLSDWVPASLPGYTSTPIIADVYTLTREYLPASGGQTDSLVVVVEQFKNATAAKRAISTGIKSSYPSDASTVQVEGRSVRFGTDGRRFATAAWNENGVLIVIEASSSTRTPAGLKAHLTALVGEIVD